MAEPSKPLFAGAQVRVKGTGMTMIVGIASAKLAICHWVSNGVKREGVFDARHLEPFSAGQQYELWNTTMHETSAGISDPA